ncbi:[FeFe] hydrogenase H-cluster radical SAM maturase HydE [Candidatus Woesearchaeota archaeon]|nr:[FeFe] hydrogenase H-cluster radical SAM maturase HydE [Candidatus Woesearchaeota archaeon]
MGKKTFISKVEAVLEKRRLAKEDIIFLLELEKKEELEKIFCRADKIRKELIGDDVFIRGIIEFSNYCRNECLYCGLRRQNPGLKRYRMAAEEIIDTAIDGVKRLGIKTILLQSGEDDSYDDGKIEMIIKGILRDCDCRIALSIGERGVDSYKRFYMAGARRCLIRFETSNKKLFGEMHPASSASKNSFDDRVRLIMELKKMGYQTGTGPIIGLPGQGVDDLAESIIMLNKLNADMAGMGPFIAHPRTPLAGEADGGIEMGLKMIAVTRICCKDIFIPATTALQSLDNENGVERALKAGANVIMPNITPKRYRELYEIYPGKANIHDEADRCVESAKDAIRSAGRDIGEGYGDVKRRAIEEKEGQQGS